MNEQRIPVLGIIITVVVLAALACENSLPYESGQSFGTPAPAPYNQDALQMAYAAAQATQESGQNEMLNLSYQATVISLNMNQAADAAAQATLENNQRQLRELSIRGNEVSENLARAAATRQSVMEQSQMAWNLATESQSRAATATYFAYIQNVTQTAQAQIDASQKAYALTATPWALIQADILRAQAEAERQAWWDETIVTPLKVILFILIILLLIVGGVLVYRRFRPVPEYHLHTGPRYDNDPWERVDRMRIDSDPSHPQLPSKEAMQVEIVGSDEPAIINWISEAEEELRSTERTQS